MDSDAAEPGRTPPTTTTIFTSSPWRRGRRRGGETTVSRVSRFSPSTCLHHAMWQEHSGEGTASPGLAPQLSCSCLLRSPPDV